MTTAVAIRTLRIPAPHTVTLPSTARFQRRVRKVRRDKAFTTKITKHCHAAIEPTFQRRVRKVRREKTCPEDHEGHDKHETTKKTARPPGRRSRPGRGTKTASNANGEPRGVCVCGCL